MLRGKNNETVFLTLHFWLKRSCGKSNNKNNDRYNITNKYTCNDTYIYIYIYIYTYIYVLSKLLPQ